MATNAVKYGALSHASGNIDIDWRIEEAIAPVVIFEWRERGGPKVNPPQRKGFGTEMLERTLAFEFKARTSLQFAPSGVQCTIVIPLSRRVVHTPVVDST